MVKSNFSRGAFTMIELIFAIVVIAISVLSLPRMIQATNKGIEANLVQEAIFAGSAQLNEAMTYVWDERSLDDLNISDLSRVVNTNSYGCPRAGIINRKCLQQTATRPLDAATVNGNSIESFTYTNEAMFTGASSASSYKEQYSASLVITRCKPGSTCVVLGDEDPNPNLKQIEYIVKDSENKVVIRLRAYNANIGELTPLGRIL
jgi:type II secretory pathway pseudopilin PulG